MLEENKKSYYAIIPATVRYDQNLCANSKLLYGEITALCNEKGYCWASNQYFAELYNVSKISVSRWITLLEQNKYIRVQLNYKENSKEVESRYIFITNHSSCSDVFTPFDNSNNEVDSESKKSKKGDQYADDIKEVIDYLNGKTGSNYRYKTESTAKLIRARIKEGYNINDFKSVIDKKVRDWTGTDFEKYLRPSTLFGNKFEQYVNQKCHLNNFNPINPMSQTTQTNKNNESSGFFYDKQGNLVTY